MAEKAKTNVADGPFMLMVHKDFDDRPPAEVTRSSFEKVWKEKGWKEWKGTPQDAREAAAAVATSPETGAIPE